MATWPDISHHIGQPRAGALVQWLNLPAWKVGDRGFKPHTGRQVVSSLCLEGSVILFISSSPGGSPGPV